MNRSALRGLLSLAALLWISSVSWAQRPAPDPSFFATKVYPVLEAAHCRLCHATDGVASGTRIHFPDKGAGQEQIEIFGLSLAPVVDRANPSNSLLFVKPTNRIKHTGGERIKPGSDEEKILNQWIQYLASASDTLLAAERRRLSQSGGATQPAHEVRRLTHSQYDNTV